MADITTIAVTIGPGTFAGVRIGLSAAKGMAMALDIPLITVTSLESLTYEFAKKNANFVGNVAVAIDARRGELYFQVFKIIDENIQAISQEEALPIPLAAKKINTNIKMIIGSGAKILNSALDGQKIDFSTDFQNPTAEFIAELSLNYGKRRLDVDHVKPLYLRAPDAKMPSKNIITKIKND
jgi:tRNA threonylcarbamoyl adenosine modification protein YeaZ